MNSDRIRRKQIKMISRIDHVSIAVHDFKKAHAFFEKLGIISGAKATDDQLKFYWNVFSWGDLSRLELIEPSGEGSP